MDGKFKLKESYIYKMESLQTLCYNNIIENTVHIQDLSNYLPKIIVNELQEYKEYEVKRIYIDLYNLDRDMVEAIVRMSEDKLENELKSLEGCEFDSYAKIDLIYDVLRLRRT